MSKRYSSTIWIYFGRVQIQNLIVGQTDDCECLVDFIEVHISCCQPVSAHHSISAMLPCRRKSLWNCKGRCSGELHRCLLSICKPSDLNIITSACNCVPSPVASNPACVEESHSLTQEQPRLKDLRKFLKSLPSDSGDALAAVTDPPVYTFSWMWRHRHTTKRPLKNWLE